MKYQKPVVIATYSEKELMGEAAVSMGYGHNGEYQQHGGLFSKWFGKWFGN